jgi:tRNA nucleotidyltransferase/poly(A) polymerase
VFAIRLRHPPRRGWRHRRQRVTAPIPAPEGAATAELPAPPEVVRIVRRLEDAGFETWAVGGAVRDALAGHPRGVEWDLTTAARPRDVQRLFKRTVPVGIAHGTVGVLGKDNQLYEVTTFRRDVETDGRHARVVFADRVEDDLQRRDFTMNAVAWHPFTQLLRDPHGGVADLRAGLLRTVGEARERFREDRLRVLRGLRFAGRFSLRIDPDTWQAARESAPELPNLSAERVREELLKVLREVTPPSTSLRLYQQAGALATLYPELEACVGVPDAAGDVWEHLLRSVDAASAQRLQPHLRLAALLHDLGRGAADVDEESASGRVAAGAGATYRLLTRLKFSNLERDRVTHLVAQHAALPGPDASAPEVRRWLRRVGREYVHDLLRLEMAIAQGRGDEARVRAAEALRRRADALMRDGAALEVGDLAIGGAELRALGIPASPLMGEILRELLEAVSDDPALNTVDALTARVREKREEMDEERA